MDVSLLHTKVLETALNPKTLGYSSRSILFIMQQAQRALMHLL